MSYSVVSFADGVCVVLHEWIVENESKCRWPNHLKSDAQLWRTLKDKQLPEHSWSTYDIIEHLGTYDSLEKANRKAAESKMYTDVQSEEEDEFPTRKKRKHAGKRRTIDDEHETSSNEEIDSNPVSLSAAPAIPASIIELSLQGNVEVPPASQGNTEDKDVMEGSSEMVMDSNDSIPKQSRQNSLPINSISDLDGSSGIQPSRPASAEPTSRSPSRHFRSRSRSRRGSHSSLKDDCSSGKSTCKSMAASKTVVESSWTPSTSKSDPFKRVRSRSTSRTRTGSHHSSKVKGNSGRSSTSKHGHVSKSIFERTSTPSTSTLPSRDSRSRSTSRSRKGSHHSLKDDCSSGKSTCKSMAASKTVVESSWTRSTSKSDPFKRVRSRSTSRTRTGSHHSSKVKGNSVLSRRSSPSKHGHVSKSIFERSPTPSTSTLPSRDSRSRSTSRSRRGSHHSLKDNGSSGKSTCSARAASKTVVESSWTSSTSKSNPLKTVRSRSTSRTRTGSHHSSRDTGNSGRSSTSKHGHVSKSIFERTSTPSTSTLSSRDSRSRSTSRSRRGSQHSLKDNGSSGKSTCSSMAASKTVVESGWTSSTSKSNPLKTVRSRSTSRTRTGSHHSSRDTGNSGRSSTSKHGHVSESICERSPTPSTSTLPSRDSRSRSTSRSRRGSHHSLKDNGSSVRGSNQTSKRTNVRGQTPPEVYDQELFRRKMIRFAVDIKVAVDSLVQTRGSDVVLEEDVTDIASLLPLTSKVELKHFEERLQTEEFKRRVIVYLARYGGSKVEDTINTMCHKTIADTLAVEYSYYGKGKMREAFNSTNLHNVMLSAVRSQKKFSHATEEDLKNVVSKFLNRAKERLTAKEFTAEKYRAKNNS